MKKTKRRWESLLLSVVLLMSTCFGQCTVTGSAEAAQSTEAMRNLTSMELVRDMSLGWNLGNSLDSCIADRDGDGTIDNTPTADVDETLWGNIRTTPEIFTTLKNQGFNAVRIPVTWRDHLGEEPDYLIDEDWMNRVQEVVDYAYNQGMYVIINLHHDGGDDTEFGAWIRRASTDKEEILEKYTAIWKQIADRFQDYSDYLIFESVNEVGFDDLSQSEGCELLNEINQTFVDLIRSSGGNNAKRHLLIGGYWTDISATSNGFFRMPEDSQNRCILSLHYYTPWQFCTTNEQKTWGSTLDGEEMQKNLDIVKEAFINQGIPVIIGEFGVGYGTEAESRIRFCGHMVSRCKAMRVPCFYWDNGEEFDRSKLEWRTEGLAEAMLQAAGVELNTTPEPGRTAAPEPTKPVVSDAPISSGIPVIPSTTPTVDIQPVPAVGSIIFMRATGSYQVTRSSDGKMPGTVSFKKAANKNIKQVSIPATVMIENLSYQVTAIQKNAFQDCKKLKKVTIGSNITKIGAGAFKGCKKLRMICVNTPSLKSVGKKAFHGIGKTPVVYVPGNKKKALHKKLGIRGIYKKQIVLNCTSLTVMQGAPDKELDTLKVIGSGSKVSWASADESIATVDSNGMVRGISGGTTTITAKVAGKRLICKVKVLPVIPVPMPEVAPTPSTEPTSAPNAAPTIVPTPVPTSGTDATERPKWTPMPLFSCEPVSSKNEEDVAVLQKLAEKYQESGIFIGTLDSWCYEWNDNGRLTAIDWRKLPIEGALEISGLPALESFKADFCDFSELKISDCESLSTVSCGYNSSLKRLDLSKVATVSAISCQGDMGQLTEVLIGDETKIRSLSVGDIPKLKWDFTPYSNLESLTTYNTNETELDLSSNKKLKYLNCYDNQLSSLKVSEGVEELRCDTNSLTELDLSKSANLRVLSCNENQLSSLDLSNNKQLEFVYLAGNELTGLNLSGNKKLTELQCEENNMTELKLDSCTSLERLWCDSNLLTDLDLSTCISLNDAKCYNNCLTKLDFGKGKTLQYLDCKNNQLTQLDVSNMELLCDLNCSDNPLNSLNISGCKNLQCLNFCHTDITSLDVTDFKDLKKIYCDSEDILIGWKYLERDDADVAALEALIHKIQEAYDASGVSDNSPKINRNYLVSPQYEWEDGKLVAIYWENCSLTGKLDISGLKNLQRLFCSRNALEELEISGCTELIMLDCRENKLKEIDASRNLMLNMILCDEGVKVDRGWDLSWESVTID